MGRIVNNKRKTEETEKLPSFTICKNQNSFLKMDIDMTMDTGAWDDEMLLNVYNSNLLLTNRSLKRPLTIITK